MTEMTIDDFIEREMDRLQGFRAAYAESQRRYPEQCPTYKDEFDWLEDYSIFVEGNE